MVSNPNDWKGNFEDTKEDDVKKHRDDYQEDGPGTDFSFI